MTRFFAYLDTSDWVTLGVSVVVLLSLLALAIDHYRMTEREEEEKQKATAMARLRQDAMKKVNDDIDREQRKAVKRANHAYHNETQWWQ